MRKHKIGFRFYSIMDYKEEAKYLGEQHKNGWRFKKCYVPGIYYFERCNPEDMIYQLDYNKEGRGNKAEYIQMFRDCGWQYISDCMGYSYFRKPVADMSGDEEIFCDDDSRVDMMKRIFRGRIIPCIIIFGLIIIPQGVILPLNQGKFTSMSFLFDMLLVMYLAMFGKFLLQYYKFKSKLRK